MELMVAMAIAAIVISAAIPSYRDFMLSTQRSEAATSLYADLLRARSEAIKRNQLVIVCRRDFYATGRPVCDEQPDGTWDEGWIVFVPADGAWSGNEPASDAEVIAVGEPVGGAVDISTDLATPVYLSFTAGGRVSDTSRFTICASGSTKGREIRLTLSGHVALREIDSCPG